MNKLAVQKYLAYKDSGEYWIGEIPEHWEIKKLKHVFKEKKKVTNPSLNCGSISFGKVVYKDDEKIPESTKASYQEVLAGEYLVNPLNLNYDLISLRIGFSSINVVVSSGYIVLKNAIELDKSFFNYLLHRYDVAYMKLLGSGVRQTISFNHIANSLLAYPPIEEQTAIANFLDDKTTKIDRAIDQKEQLIALLKGRKQIIIQNAVTKGLDPNVKLKESGVEWIGEIPEGWGVKKLKHVAEDFMYGTSVDCNETSIGTPVLRIPNVGDKKVVFENLKYTNLSQEETRKYTLLNNDILIIRTNGNPELVGKSCLFISDSIYMYASYLIRIRPKGNIIPSFFIQVLNSDSVRKSLTFSAKTSVGNYNLNTQSLGDCYLAYPPKGEQNGILKFIESQSAKIEQAISLQQTQIEKLKEYKATLIDSAVTGKIKVS